MSDLTAQLQLRYGVVAPPVTFALESDQLDAIINAPIMVNDVLVFGWDWTDEQYREYYQNKEILKINANGRHHVRLYAPVGIDVDLVATERPVSIKARPIIRFGGNFGHADATVASAYIKALLSFQDMTKVLGAQVVGILPERPAPPDVEYVGVKEDVYLDTIEFNNSRVAHMKYNYVTSGFETAFLSRFVTNDGRTIAPPIWIPDLNGGFALEEPATGALVIRYLVPYRLFKVNYGIPNGLEVPGLQMAYLRGDITTFQMPPVKVLAIAPTAGRVASVDFQRDIYPKGARLATWNSKGFAEAQQGLPSLFIEQSRVTQDVVVTDSQNPDNTITVQKARVVTMFDDKGRPFTFKLSG